MLIYKLLTPLRESFIDQAQLHELESEIIVALVFQLLIESQVGLLLGQEQLIESLD